MANDFLKICITRVPISTPEPGYTKTAGAVLDFHGVVRSLENGDVIAGIDYEVYAEMAEQKLRQITAETSGKFSLEAVLLIHRVGFVPVGEPSLFLRVASSHRAEAFGAGSEIIERLKQEVPIWKNPVQTPRL